MNYIKNSRREAIEKQLYILSFESNILWLSSYHLPIWLVKLTLSDALSLHLNCLTSMLASLHNFRVLFNLNGVLKLTLRNNRLFAYRWGRHRSWRRGRCLLCSSWWSRSRNKQFRRNFTFIDGCTSTSWLYQFLNELKRVESWMSSFVFLYIEKTLL